jgi:hypothetical protein
MFRLMKFGVPLFLVVALTSPVYSADQIMIPEEGTLELMLLRQKSVRDELKLTEEVAELAKKHAGQQWKKAQEVSELSEREQQARFDEMAAENEKFLEKHLTQAQRERLEQITLQVAGLMYVTRPVYAEKLKLTADQKQRAKELQKGARDELEKLIEAKDSKDRHKEIVALWEVNHQRLEKLLTESQKATWKSMTGPEFKGEFTYTASKSSG